MARVPDPAVHQAWMRRFREFRQGNASVAEFCRLAGVSVAAFYQWRRKLRPESEPSTTAVPRETSRIQFVPIELTAGPRLEVHLPSGARVFVPCHDSEVIRAVITAAAGELRENESC